MMVLMPNSNFSYAAFSTTFACVLLLLALANCAVPRTKLPDVRQADIAAEANMQRKFLYEQDFSLANIR